MFDAFFKTLEAFENDKFESPLLETLKLFDFFTNDAISKINFPLLEKSGVNFKTMIKERKKEVPLQYIYGKRRFFGLEFFCSRNALIPREETELLADCAINLIRSKENQNQLIVDMGTGCANVAVSIAINTENTVVLASDLKQATINTAQKNVELHNISDRIRLFYGDLFAPIPETYKMNIDMVVCNPPYIPSSSLKNLPKEIIEHEPKEAFDAGAFGINFYKRLIAEACTYLKPNGILIFEIGLGQEKLVTRLINKSKLYKKIEYYDDGQNIRVISMEKK